MRLSELLDTTLPLNRKERFFTGTVLPMLVASENMSHLDRFLELCGVRPAPPIRGNPENCNVLFFTEYGVKESIFGEATSRFRPPLTRDTPDLVIFVDGEERVLLGVEAKMYVTPPAAALNSQLNAQGRLLRELADQVGRSVVHQVALIPDALNRKVGPLSSPVVTWEQVLQEFQSLAPAYWVAMLEEALVRYEDLVARGPSFGENMDARMSGVEIVRLCGSSGTEYTWMGRMGGLEGPLLADDISNNGWRSRRYEVRRDAPDTDNPNWFPINEFVARVAPLEGEAE